MSAPSASPLLVVAAAGRGSRFRSVGYDQPKPRIEFQGRPLLEWSLIGLGFARGMEARVVVQRSDDLADFTRQSFKTVGLPVPGIIELDAQTDGQASTVRCALRESDGDRPLVIWNVDTYLRPGTIPAVPVGNWLHLFPNDSPSMSFAAVDEGRVTRVAEKVVISEWASSGLYGFASCRQFAALTKRSVTDSDGAPAARERFVAPLYQFLIDEGAPVVPVLGAAEDVLPLGTPEDLAKVTRPLSSDPDDEHHP